MCPTSPGWSFWGAGANPGLGLCVLLVAGVQLAVLREPQPTAQGTCSSLGEATSWI